MLLSGFLADEPIRAESSGLAAWYRFDETSGSTASDSSGNGHHGSISGATPAAGVRGGAFDFDGSDDYVQIPVLNGGQVFSAATLMAWVNLDTVSKSEQDVIQLATSDGFINLCAYGDDVVLGIDRVPGHNQAGGTVSDILTTGRWFHIAGSYDGTSIKVFVNGVLGATVSAPGTLRAAYYTNKIGRRVNAVLCQVDGRIDDVKIYDRALGATEIAAEASLERTIDCAGDTFIKDAYPNKNFGDETYLRVNCTGRNRALVQFDEDDIEDAVGSMTLDSATLRLYIEDNTNNWGSEGRDVGAHLMKVAWTEMGATWNSPDDQDTSNRKVDGDSWTMGKKDSSLWPFEATATDVVRFTNQLTGWVEWDVTDDVQAWLDDDADCCGWIVKKEDESKFGAAKMTSLDGNDHAPELVLVLK
jgi:hypothetical protein